MVTRRREGEGRADRHRGPSRCFGRCRRRRGRALSFRRGVAELVERIERAITVYRSGARARRGTGRCGDDLNQLLPCRQWHSLIKELKDAEQALGRMTEANYTWLQDVKARRMEIEGTEALVEGSAPRRAEGQRFLISAFGLGARLSSRPRRGSCWREAG